MKILILEDEPVSMKKLTMDLESFGHEVVAVTDSMEAIGAYYEHTDLGLIITDLAMPHGSGEDFIKDIRSVNKKIPVIVISGTIDNKMILIKLKQLNCKDILVKPHDKKRLKSIIDSL